MKKILTLALIILFLGAVIGIVYADEIKKGDILFARYDIRGSGNTIFFHNMSASPIVIPRRTKVEITGVDRYHIMVQRMDNAKKYRVVAFSEFWNKFFVRDKSEIEPRIFSADKKAAIENNQVLEGMTKEEVYLSKGCPAYIGYGVKSERHSLDEVMRSDVWYYNVNSRIKDAVITFKDGKVSGIADRTTKVKKKIDALKDKK